MELGEFDACQIREVTVAYRGGSEREIGDATDSAKFARELIGDETREVCLALYLDSSCQPIGYRTVAIGTADTALVSTRGVFQPAVGLGAAAVVLIHNHPSGNPQPSREDVVLTARVMAAGEVIGCQLLDHIVIGRDSHVSIRDEVKAGKWDHLEGSGTPEAEPRMGLLEVPAGISPAELLAKLEALLGGQIDSLEKMSPKDPTSH
jgi:DNA repair protein RadC